MMCGIETGDDDDMANNNLSRMGLEELVALQKEVESAISTCRERNRKEARAAAEAAAAEKGFSLRELMNGDAWSKRGPMPKPPKYRHPENPALTWSDRGRKPAWFADAVSSGVSEDQMRINPG
jgi:DNA-binding protein H-NS